VTVPDGSSNTSRRLTACLSFDFDAMSVWIAGTDNPAAISRGEFSTIAVPRILALLERHEILGTFFIPGHTAFAYPDLVRQIRDAGHEIGHHGWVHENPASFDYDGERRIFERGLEALDRVAGVRPVGYRSPSNDLSPRSMEILLKYKMRYDSSCGGSDFTPYYQRINDRISKSEPYIFGPTVDLVEVPFSWILDDFPHMEFDAGWSTEQSPPSTVLEIWRGEFRYAYQHAMGGVFNLCMHPQVIGRGHRMMMLEEMIESMKLPGVVFESLADFAARWQAENPLSEWQASNPVRAGTNALGGEFRSRVPGGTE
jgi:peptidoglycan/xylan/chitin deacetylase (PgdA/CDA1 family)